jgi:Cu/Ag efflux protein CusF
MEMGGMEMGGSEQGEVQEFAFTGVVQSVDTTTGIVSVANDEIPGWMMAMTMNYYLEPPDAIATLEAGDRITATVYSGDVQHLYDVQRVENP